VDGGPVHCRVLKGNAFHFRRWIKSIFVVNLPTCFLVIPRVFPNEQADIPTKMDKQRAIGVYTKELPSRANSTISDPFKDPTATSPWSPTPQPLTESKLSRWLNLVYDLGLCIAPLLLILKVGLVFKAYHTDKGSSGSVTAPPSNITVGLVQFNSYVIVRALR
jgi:hypothetical protein